MDTGPITQLGNETDIIPVGTSGRQRRASDHRFQSRPVSHVSARHGLITYTFAWVLRLLYTHQASSTERHEGLDSSGAIFMHFPTSRKNLFDQGSYQ